MLRVLFVSGEPSGDANIARLIRDVRARHPDWTLYALGGEAVRQSGATIVGDSSGLGVIGLASALAVYPRALMLRRKLLKFLNSIRPDLAVLCDWGAFNGRLLPDLKALGVPVLYYFPPRSWQKGGAGGLQIVPFVARVATPFSWSAQRLKEAGANAEWVGHPLLEEVAERPSRDRLRHEFGIAPGERLVALLPGSRAMEINLLTPVMAQTVEMLHRRGVADKFLAAVAPQHLKRVREMLPPEVMVVEGRATDVLKACDAAIVKSGTSTLQAAVCDAPQVIVYDVPPLLRAQWKWTGMARKTPFVGMPNIICEREICRELLGPECRPQGIADEISLLLENSSRRERMLNDYSEVRRALGSELPQGATTRVAEMVEEATTEERRERRGE